MEVLDAVRRSQSATRPQADLRAPRQLSCPGKTASGTQTRAGGGYKDRATMREIWPGAIMPASRAPIDTRSRRSSCSCGHRPDDWRLKIAFALQVPGPPEAALGLDHDRTQSLSTTAPRHPLSGLRRACGPQRSSEATRWSGSPRRARPSVKRLDRVDETPFPPDVRLEAR